MPTLPWEPGWKVGMLPGGYREAQGCLFEHSPLLPPQLRTVLLWIFTASNQAENLSGQH